MFQKFWRSFYPCYAVRRTGLRFASTSFVLRVPPSSAPREVPTPLVFVSSRSWDEDSSDGMTLLSSMLAEKGFTCIQTDLATPEDTVKVDSASMMKAYECDLTSAVRLSAIPFPPVIFARASACLIAETYISSNPASGMVLIAPPVSNAQLSEAKLLPTPLEEFNYEPKFPIAVIATPEHAKRLRESNRICQSGNVDVIEVKDLNQQKMIIQVELWLDQLGFASQLNYMEGCCPCLRTTMVEIF